MLYPGLTGPQSHHLALTLISCVFAAEGPAMGYPMASEEQQLVQPTVCASVIIICPKLSSQLGILKLSSSRPDQASAFDCAY